MTGQQDHTAKRLYGPYLDLPLMHLPNSIADAAALEAANERLGGLEIAGWVPPPIGIEIPLSTRDPGFDLSVGFATGFGNRNHLQSFLKQRKSDPGNLPTSLQSGVLEGFDNLWLEYDLITPQSRRPSLYFAPDSVDPHHSTAQEEIPAVRLVPDRIGSIMAAIRTLEPGMPEQIIDRLEGMLGDYEDPHAYVLCGIMLGRQPTTVRLVLRFESAQTAIPFLNRFGYKRHSRGLEELNEDFGDLIVKVLVGCELGNPDLLGVELYAPDGLLQPGNPDYELFERLVAIRLCNPAKRDALQSFPGYSAIASGKEYWSRWERRDGAGEGSMQVPICERRFHHVKIALTNGKVMAAKAYLSALFRWWIR